jgi:quercetin dioxygenase-like cupin family protein
MINEVSAVPFLKDLRRLTDNLHCSADAIWPLAGNKEVLAYRLHREPGVAVLRACIEYGSPFPRHQHSEAEVIICYSGMLAWKINTPPFGDPGQDVFDVFDEEDADGILEPGEVLRIAPNTPHTIMAIGGMDAWVIAITVPATEGF